MSRIVYQTNHEAIDADQFDSGARIVACARLSLNFLREKEKKHFVLILFFSLGAYFSRNKHSSLAFLCARLCNY